MPYLPNRLQYFRVKDSGYIAAQAQAPGPVRHRPSPSDVMMAVCRFAGWKTFVASVMPPKPVSTTARSTEQSAKYLHAQHALWVGDLRREGRVDLIPLLSPSAPTLILT
ncbi:hypothetical protein Vafri_618 [Volvox africanus]|nr:hypothetical protein Vafri_618 [Volvox africanus]